MVCENVTGTVDEWTELVLTPTCSVVFKCRSRARLPALVTGTLSSQRVRASSLRQLVRDVPVTLLVPKSSLTKYRLPSMIAAQFPTRYRVELGDSALGVVTTENCAALR